MNGTTLHGYDQIINGFNLFFTNIKSESSLDIQSCFDQCNKHFENLISSATFKTKNFSFSLTNRIEVENLIADYSESSRPGYTSITPKLVNPTANFISPFLSNLFNKCLVECKIPHNLKIALVTPLFKNKGSEADVNNYRSISVLSPIVKIFENIHIISKHYMFNYLN